MTRLIIQAANSHKAEDSVRVLLQAGFTAKTARISYEVGEGLPPMEDVDSYPLILEGRMSYFPVTIYVTPVTAGYSGSGPHAMVNILKAAGFTFDESDILTEKMRFGPTEKVELTYTR